MGRLPHGPREGERPWVSRLVSSYSAAVGGTLFFSAEDASVGVELWKSDGTAGGTVLVRDIWPVELWCSSPHSLTNVAGTLVFVADDGVHGDELWRSDGTWAGTTLLSDIAPGSATSSPDSLVSSGDAVYFLAGNQTSGRELWRSDGTAGGTAMVVDHQSSSSWPAAMTEVDGTVFFAADSDGAGRELHYRDPGGTVHLVDIWPGPGSSSPTLLTRVGDRLFFLADDGVHGRELWTSDTSGTVALLADLTPGSDDSWVEALTDVGGTLFFLQGDMLWKSDGTPGGTVAVKNAVWAYELEAVGTTVYFWNYDPARGEELWKSNGTAAGTVLVKDIFPGGGSSYPRYLTNVGGTLYFAAGDGVHGTELWKSNGTAAGTVLVKDIATGAASSDPGELTAVGRSVFFWAGRASDGYELWRSNGTASGTARVKDIWPGPESSYVGVPPCAIGDALAFVAYDPAHGIELWRSDGTAAGTTLVSDIFPGAESSVPLWLTPVNGLVFFQAWEPTTGSELWASDGTAEGTRAVGDINPGPESSNPSNLEDRASSTWWSRPFALSGSRLFFSAYDGDSGHELWSLAAVAPAITDQWASGLGPAWATLESSVVPGGVAASGYFEYGLDGSYGETTLSSDLGSGTEGTTLAADLTGLECDAEYHFRTVATNGDWTVRGTDTFRTWACSVFQLAAATYSVAETGPVATLKVTRTGGTAGGVSVSYSTADGTATAGVDYQAVSGTLTFAAGQTALSVTVPILSDVLDEANETVLVSLHDPGPALLDDSRHVDHRRRRRGVCSVQRSELLGEAAGRRFIAVTRLRAAGESASAPPPRTTRLGPERTTRDL
jgi:ELWxxDGT repeat protein